jgi:hypothetical protein
MVFWDGKSKRRVAEALAAVKNNIVPSGYKENREKDLDKIEEELISPSYSEMGFLDNLEQLERITS